jgi:hypothetical protein
MTLSLERFEQVLLALLRQAGHTLACPKPFRASSRFSRFSSLGGAKSP